MANHNLPQTTSTYTNFVAEIDARFDDLAVGLDPAVTTVTNMPTNSIRWNSVAKYWEKYNGTAWVVNSASYSININGTVGDTTALDGKFSTLSTTGIASLAANSTVGSNPIVSTTGVQTLSAKTLTLPKINDTSSNNTYDFAVNELAANRTITLPLLGANDIFVFESHSQTLSNKTLTAPKFTDLGFIADINGNELLIFDSNAAAVNEITFTNAATTLKPSISATGGDTNISLNLISKGTGTVQANSIDVVTTTGSQTLDNKILTTPTLAGTASGTTAGRLGYLSGALSYGNGTVQRIVVNTDEAQSITSKTLSTGSTWQGNAVGVIYGGTGTTAAPVQGGAIYGSSTSAYASTAAGTTYQVLQSNGTSAPTWASIDLSLHLIDSAYKKIVRLATAADLGASTFVGSTLTGYSNTQSLALTTTAASTTITTTTTAGLKVGAVVNLATAQVASGTTVATIVNATSFTVSNRAAITTTAITGTGATATATFAAQTYIPYAVGSTIVVSGTTPVSYSGSFVVTACTTTSVSWASVETVAATVQGSINFTIAAGTSVTTAFSQTIAALSVDGVATVVNDRILVKDQQFLGSIQATDTAKHNGIYYVSAIGSTTVPWTLVRTTDADAATDIDSAIVNVSVGTTNGGKSFKTYFTGTSTLNTTPMYWNRLIDASSSGLMGLPTTAIGIDIATDTKTQTLVTGAVTDLAINSLGITTVKAVGASAYTRASTLYIAGAPVASTNATITTPYSIYVAGGNTYLGGTSTLVGAVTANSTINGLTLAAASLSSAAGTNLSLTSGTTGTVTLDSGSTGAVQVGTNANAKTITIGNATGATAVNINTGTGGISLLTGTTGAVSIDTGTTGAINIGTNANAKVITIGNATGVTSFTVNTGTGGAFFTASTVSTTQMANSLILKHQTSGTPANGIGLGIVFDQLTAAGNTERGLLLQAIATDVTAASEDFDFVVSLMAGGATAAEKLRVTSAGNTKASAFFDISAAADTATAASHYYVETATDGLLRPKTLANTIAEIVTAAAVSTVAVAAGSTTLSALKYNGTTAAAGQLDGGTTTPTGTTRLNYGGYFYPTYINLVGSPDTATAATHYFVETGTDGFVRPKTLANVQTEVVTTAAVAAAGGLSMGTAAKTAAYTVLAADRGDVLMCSNTWSLTLTAVATLGNGFTVGVINAGTGTITIDPNAAELVDGLATKALTPGQSCLLVCDGTGWRTLGLSGGGAKGGGADDIFYENSQAVTVDYTVGATRNSMSAGPITINNGIIVTISTGGNWVIV